MQLIQKVCIVLFAVLQICLGNLFAQIEYPPFNLYSDQIDSNIHHVENYFETTEVTSQPAQSLNLLGFLMQNYLITSQSEKAEKLVDKYMSFDIVDNNPSVKATLLFWKGNVFKSQNLLPEALNCYFESARIFTEFNDWTSLMAIKIELAEFYRKYNLL